MAQAIKRVAVLGAGMMGYAAAFELTQFEPYFQVTICDCDPIKLKQIKALLPVVNTIQLDLSEPMKYYSQFRGVRGIFSALPYYLNPGVAGLALKVGAHYVDLGGNTRAVEDIFSLGDKARDRSVALLPDAGLAPGLVNILTAYALRLLPSAHTIKIRVGGIPVVPKAPLDYALVFSVEGLINEYREPCRLLRDGRIVVVPPLTDIEEISFLPDFPKLEAFNTSGGSSTLPLTYASKIKNLDYKTIRYPGHAKKVKVLLDLGLMSSEKVTIGDQKVIPAEFLAEILRMKLRQNEPDVVLLRVLACDDKDQVILEMVDYGDALAGLSAMMRATSFTATCLLREQIAGNIPAGVWRLEEVVDGEKVISELARRSINITIMEGPRGRPKSS